MNERRIGAAVVVACLAALVGVSDAGAGPERDIVLDVDSDGFDDSAVTQRLQQVSGILGKADKRIEALETSFESPQVCDKTLFLTDPACQQIFTIGTIAGQADSLLSRVDDLDDGTDPESVMRRIQRIQDQTVSANERLAGIIGPEIAGIIGPEIAGIIGPEIAAGIIGPEIAGIIGPEIAGIIGPEIAGIIGPEVTADVAGIIGPEVAGIIGPEREQVDAELDAIIARAEAQIFLAYAVKHALPAP